MNTRNQKILLSALLALTACIFLVSMYALFFIIPSIAEEVYGPPSPNLDISQRILLSTYLLINRKNLTYSNQIIRTPQPFLIETGATAGSVAERLKDLGIISNARLVINYWVYTGKDRLVQEGVYLIQPESSPLMIADKLVNNTPENIAFAFLPGWRKEEIEHLLKTSKIFPENVLFKELESEVLQTCFPSEENQLTTVEGFLFPGEYQIPVGFSPEEILCAFSEKFLESLPEDYDEIVKTNNLSLYEAVILASIVEKEVIVKEEAPIIADVFINRLNADMPLQSDPTVQYAIADDSSPRVWWKNPLEAADLKVDSPYNTYLHNGLPPSPICNPGLNSLNAVAYPKNTDYFYFRASCDGTGRHIFSRTYEEHLKAACE